MASESSSSAAKRRKTHHSTSSSTKATEASAEQAECASAKALKLPEIVQNVLSNLSAFELFALARVSRTFNDTLKTGTFQKNLGLAHTREMTDDNVNNGDKCPGLRGLPFRGTVALARQRSHRQEFYPKPPGYVGEDIIQFGRVEDLLNGQKAIVADRDDCLPIVIARSKSIPGVVFRFDDLQLVHVCCSGEHRQIHLHFDAHSRTAITSKVVDLEYNYHSLQWPPDEPKASWMKMKISEISAGVRVSLGPSYSVASGLYDCESLVLSAEAATLGNHFTLLNNVCLRFRDDERFWGQN